jgi:hypothetical protein
MLNTPIVMVPAKKPLLTRLRGLIPAAPLIAKEIANSHSKEHAGAKSKMPPPQGSSLLN